MRQTAADSSGQNKSVNEIKMKLELQSAANFVVHLIKLGRINIDEDRLQNFKLALIEVLRRRFLAHLVSKAY